MEMEKYCNNIEVKEIVGKLGAEGRISKEEALVLYEKASLPLLGILADQICSRKNGLNVYYNRNIHIEPTNICVNSCRFCSYSRKEGASDSWESTKEEMLNLLESASDRITEVHIVGGIHPDRDLYYYIDLLRRVKKGFPHLCIKAFTAAEIDFMTQKAGIGLVEGIRMLKEVGLQTVPGGGAEIFEEEIRKQICPEKISSQRWLEIHEVLHQEGISTNATILYGHIESYAHRIDHLDRLRSLQDKTAGFHAFIPLKFRNRNNSMSYVEEVSVIEDLKMYAMARIFLDNVPHIKAYWPAVGKSFAQISLSFGVDDIDGTIQDSTKIYSMAGVEDQNPVMGEEEMKELIRTVGKKPVERDSLYRIISEDE